MMITKENFRRPLLQRTRVARAGVLLLLVLLLACACRAVVARTAPAGQPVDLWERIDAYVEGERQATRIPGIALGVVRGDSVLRLAGFGVADPSGRAVTPRTAFYIGSATKSITAVAIMQLVEQGVLELDAPVQRYLPWFTLADPEAASHLTVRHLLTQTSGLPRAAGMDVATNRADVRDGALERQVRAWRTAELATPPGAAFQYNNANYVILGLLVETRSGQTFESYVREHIFGPLQMNDAALGPVEDGAPQLATGYRYWFGVPRAADLEFGRVSKPAGGVVASVDDMTHYLAAHLNGGRYRDAQILSAGGIDAMRHPAVTVPEGYGPRGFDGAAYGFGWFVGTRGGMLALAHPGDLPTFHSDVMLLPEEGIGIVLLTNANDRLTGERMRAIIDGVTSLVLGGSPTPADPEGNAALIVFRMVVALALAQMAAIAWSVRTMRRWAVKPESRPRGAWAGIRHILIPLGSYLSLALIFLVGLPLLMNLPRGLLVESVPDLGAVALVSGSVALGWGIVRTLLAYRSMRP